MNPEERKIFNHFKRLVIATYLKNNSGSIDVKKWSGDDIISFQEDLFSKVNTKVSEKWFYSYFKNEPEKLPRIDILNILSKYIDFESWEDFKKKSTLKKPKIYLFLIIATTLLIFFLITKNSKNTFHFCFYNEDKNEQITIPIDIKILKRNESPLFFKSDKNGCFEYDTQDNFLKLVISSSYYKTDTIRRQKNNKKNIINLTTDDYALMLDYYTNNKLKNWNQRKTELEKLIDNKAIIYQLFSKNIGVEIYNKNEFINLLTIPTNSLKHIKIISKEFKKDKIVKLKFIVE